jgi:hypothetical protein
MKKPSLKRHVGVSIAAGLILFVVLCAFENQLPILSEVVFGTFDSVTPHSIIGSLTEMTFGKHNDERGLVYVAIAWALFTILVSSSIGLATYGYRVRQRAKK